MKANNSESTVTVFEAFTGLHPVIVFSYFVVLCVITLSHVMLLSYCYKNTFINALNLLKEFIL